MATVIHGYGLYGAEEVKTLCGFPKGKVRIRVRSKDFVKIYIKTSDGIREFIPKLAGNYWVPFAEVGSNKRINTQDSVATGGDEG